jgi:hypothetical protein
MFMFGMYSEKNGPKMGLLSLSLSLSLSLDNRHTQDAKTTSS